MVFFFCYYYVLNSERFSEIMKKFGLRRHSRQKTNFGGLLTKAPLVKCSDKLDKVIIQNLRERQYEKSELICHLATS